MLANNTNHFQLINHNCKNEFAFLWFPGRKHVLYHRLHVHVVIICLNFCFTSLASYFLQTKIFCRKKKVLSSRLAFFSLNNNESKLSKTSPPGNLKLFSSSLLFHNLSSSLGSLFLQCIFLFKLS